MCHSLSLCPQSQFHLFEFAALGNISTYAWNSIVMVNVTVISFFWIFGNTWWQDTYTHKPNIHLRYSVTLCVVNMMLMMNKVTGENERAPDHNISIIIHFHIKKKFVILKIYLSVDHQNIHPILLFPSQLINYLWF